MCLQLTSKNISHWLYTMKFAADPVKSNTHHWKKNKLASFSIIQNMQYWKQIDKQFDWKLLILAKRNI